MQIEILVCYRSLISSPNLGWEPLCLQFAAAYQCILILSSPHARSYNRCVKQYGDRRKTVRVPCVLSLSKELESGTLTNDTLPGRLA